jgi:hypothetical protein
LHHPLNEGRYLVRHGLAAHDDATQASTDAHLGPVQPWRQSAGAHRGSHPFAARGRSGNHHHPRDKHRHRRVRYYPEPGRARIKLQPADSQQFVQLTPTSSAELTWSVLPTTTGTATLAVTTGNTSEHLGVSVLSGNGFVPPQRATANYLGILLGALLAVESLLWWGALPSRAERTVPQSAPSSPPTPATPPPQP